MSAPKTIDPPHWVPVEFYETAAQARARREVEVAREALGLPKTAAVAMVEEFCGVTRGEALRILDRVATAEREAMRSAWKDGAL